MTPTSLRKADANRLPKCNLIQDSWCNNTETELYMINKMNTKTIFLRPCVTV